MKKQITLILILLITSFSSTFAQRIPVSWSSGWDFFEASPLVSVKLNDHVVDSMAFTTPSLEAGIVLINGTYNEWTAFGGIPLGADWAYWGPYVSTEYALNTKKGRELGMNRSNLYNGFSFDVGVTGGIGAVALILPLSINGTLGYKTDFNSSAFKYSVGVNLKKVSLNMGSYVNFNRSQPFADAAFVEVKMILWDKL